MYIQGINGYLSKFEGTEVDAAVERVQGLDAELALKVDKTTKVNGHELTGDINITAEDVGAMPIGAGYGKGLKWDSNSYILRLLDQNGRELSSQAIEIDLGRWGHIIGNISDQPDLQAEFDTKQDLITSENMLSSDLVDDIGHIHKFATAEQLQQIATNTSNIATNTADIATNTANIATNTTDIATNRNNIATNTANIATNTSNIATNTADIATNAANIATNTTDIATNRTDINTNTTNIATNTADISTINSKIPSAATAQNQLADKAFVNSSIATSTATFRGTFNSLADLEAYTGPKDDNDYAFVVEVDSAGNTLYERYKYDGTQWLFEYTLNNSSFTAVQWAAINSGATTTNIGQIATNTSNIATNTSDIATNAANIATNTNNIATNTQDIATNRINIATNTSDITAINNTLNTFGDVVTYNASDFATAAQGAKADTALQSIDSTLVVNALGYTPYDATNPDGFISGITSSDVTTALGYTPYDSTNPDGFISGITSSDVTTALGYTPYDATNPDGFISGITDTMVVNALGYTPYDSTNPDGFISGITSSDVVTALGYTPYDSTNPDGFISSAALSTLTDTNITNVVDGQHLVYDSTEGKWKNSSVVSMAWGNITGTLANQTDLQTALDGKQPTITGAATTIVDSDLTTSRVLISDTNGKVGTSSITTTKLGYLSDVNSNIQVQLNSKISSAAVSTLTDVTLTDLANGEFLKYNSSTHKWENSTVTVTSTLEDLTDVVITNPTQGQNLTYDSVNNKWINTSTTSTVAWGGITGTLTDQTDLKDALDSKASVTFRDWSVS